MPESTAPVSHADLATEHLRLRLRPLHAALAVAVDRQTAENERLARPDLTPLCVSAQEAELLVERTRACVDALAVPPRPAVARAEAGTSPEHLAEEQALRRRASAADVVLPLDALARRFRLVRSEEDALLLAVAPELDRAWQRAYAYVVDDLNRQLPSVELIVTVLVAGGTDPALARRLLAPSGTLRRTGLLRPWSATSPGWAQELVPGPGVAEFVLFGAGIADLLGDDPDAVVPPPGYAPAPQPDGATVRRLATAVNEGWLDLIGLWGGTGAARRDAALALALAAGRPLRTIALDAPHPQDGAFADRLRVAAQVASELAALLWVPVDGLTPEARAVVVDLLARCRVPAVLTGIHAYRPAALLAVRSYAEIAVDAPDYGQRRDMWAQAVPGLGEGALVDLATRYRMSGEELRAVAAVARTGARLAGNGRPAPLHDHLASAIASVTRGRSAGHTRGFTPTRTMADLVLPAEQLAHVQEIAAAFRTWPRVAETWGFRRRAGDAGVKVLFTGEPGTGKTLSAEVLAHSLGLELLCVDLSQIVSKWVGETEKNLESAFSQAEESQALLFFDEADALFGKRGDVRHGTDRWANLEVGYLLQRLESSDALVILASNLRENIDPAFIRRFHFAVHFSRPGPEERRRLWRGAFPASAPLAPDVDLDALTQLDMTGAGIVAAARSSALLAADSGTEAISMRDVVRGVARQYQREARLLRPAELGPHARLLGDAGSRTGG